MQKHKQFIEWLKEQGLLTKAVDCYRPGSTGACESVMLDYLQEYGHKYEDGGLYACICSDLQVECPREFFQR